MLQSDILFLGAFPARDEEGKAPFSGSKGQILREFLGVEKLSPLVKVANILGFTPVGGFPIRVAGLLVKQFTLPPKTLVVGKRVAALFDLGGADYLEWWEIGEGREMAVIPDLSLTTPWWSWEDNKERAKEFILGSVKVSLYGENNQ